jgi:5'-3' exonuclease
LLVFFQFIDLCILLGCDYCGSIRGIGPKRAVELIKEHKSIERILEKIDKQKFAVPEDWAYQQARRLFQNPEVTDPDELTVSTAIYPLVFKSLLKRLILTVFEVHSTAFRNLRVLMGRWKKGS